MCSYLRRPSARVRPLMPPPAMAMLKAFGLDDSVVGDLVVDAIV